MECSLITSGKDQLELTLAIFLRMEVVEFSVNQLKDLPILIKRQEEAKFLLLNLN